MKVEISYTFNASALGGKNLVTFEELYDLSNPDEPVKVAEHKDIEDDGQTVLITERIIKIHTTATDKNSNKELEAGKDVTIIDTVTLEGLEIGTQYKLVGWQMLKEENAELLINGKRVESDYTFTADSETMKVEVAFTFDASGIAIIGLNNVTGKLEDEAFLFVPKEEVTSVKFNKKLMSYELEISTSKGTLAFKVNKTMVGASWHKENLATILKSL
ncbi:VaFE repeat-containing surface-anchored protein [Mediterraneibacter gnavus]|nr:VaFE repeat-containing surface-anchored protein [Mediterraneibacter gnavus]UZT24993.1 VaFE repeat-containing surface-anchored protein [Mediterraneibacter gnavus]